MTMMSNRRSHPRMFSTKKKTAGESVSKRSDLPLPIFIYSPGYNLQLEAHVFPAVKFSLIHARLKEDPAFAEHRFFEPIPASYDDVATVHKKDYLQDLLTQNFS